MELERIASGLVVVEDKETIEPKPVVLVSDFIETMVKDNEIKYSQELKKVHDCMCDIVENIYDSAVVKWMLYMSYAGRCWVLESVDNQPALSYIDYPTKSDWEIVGIKVL